MKDSYSFDRDEAGLDESFRKHAGAYQRIFERCGIETHEVAGRVGDDGRQRSRSTSSRRPARARTRSSPARTATTRPTSRSRAAVPPRADFPDRLDAPAGGRDARRQRRSRRSRSSSASTRARPRRRCRSSRPTARSCSALVRGDDRLERDEAGRRARRRPPARRRTRRSARRSAPSGGSLGPVGFAGDVIADETLREGQFVAGANRDGVAPARRRGRPRLPAALRRPARVRGGRPLPVCGGALTLPDRDRGRPHLQARHALLGAARGDVPGRGRHGEAAGHGQLRDRPGPHHGRRGRAAPRRERDRLAARRSRRTTSMWSRCRASRSRPRRPRARSTRPGRTSSSTTATRDAGEKFADADLIGLPLRVTVGKKTLEDGMVDVRDRASGEERRVPARRAGEHRLDGRGAAGSARSRSGRPSSG